MKKTQTNGSVQDRSVFRHPRRKDSFTLVEVLVAMTVLSVIILALGSLMELVAQTWLAGINAGNNFAKARTMLTVLDRDTQMMVLRRDLAAFTDNTGTTPLCSFYTTVQGQPGVTSTPVDTREISLVNYSLQQLPSPATATNSILERHNCGMNYSTTAANAMTPSVGNSTQMTQWTNTIVASLPPENVANGVIAFQWQFVDGTGGLLTPSYVEAGTNNPQVPFFYDFTNPGAGYNPRSLVVSMVVVSDSAYQLAIQTGTLGKLIAQFPTQIPSAQTTTMGSTTYDTETYAKLWSGVLNPATGTFAQGQGLPKAVIGSGTIQVFERHIPLPLITPSS